MSNLGQHQVQLRMCSPIDGQEADHSSFECIRRRINTGDWSKSECQTAEVVVRHFVGGEKPCKEKERLAGSDARRIAK